MSFGKVKSYILMSLFICSILLSLKLFVDFEKSGIEATENLSSIENEEEVLADFISPERIMLNYSEENHAVFYSDFGTYFWINTRKLFSNSFLDEEISFSAMSEEDYINLKNQRSITYKFSNKLPLGAFFIANGDDMSNALINTVPNISEFTISISSNFFVVLKNNNQYVKVEGIDYDISRIEAEFDQVRDKDYVKYRTGNIVSASKEVLVPLNLEETQTNIFVSNDMNLKDIEHIESIVKRFFGSIEKTRKIEENDGTLIYMSNNKGLVFTKDGIVKYFDEIKTPVKKRDLEKSLKTYAAFISGKDYMPQNIYIADIQPIENGSDQGYKLSFGYKLNTKKVILDDGFSKDLKYPIEVEVYNDYIKSYKRYYRKTSSLDRLNSFTLNIEYIMKPLDILENNIDLIRYNYMKENNLTKESMETIDNAQILSTLKDINAAYYDYCGNLDDSKLVEVWIITLGKKTYIWDAYSGNLLKNTVN